MPTKIILNKEVAALATLETVIPMSRNGISLIVGQTLLNQDVNISLSYSHDGETNVPLTDSAGEEISLIVKVGKPATGINLINMPQGSYLHLNYATSATAGTLTNISYT